MKAISSSGLEDKLAWTWRTSTWNHKWV